MGWYILIQIILQFVTHLFLPGYLLYDLWKQPGASRFKWLVKLIHHSSYVFYIFLAGRWGHTRLLSSLYVYIFMQSAAVRGVCSKGKAYRCFLRRNSMREIQYS